MKKKLLAVAMVCVLMLGIGVAASGFEPFNQGPPLHGECHMNGGPGRWPGPLPGPNPILPPWTTPWW